MTNLQNTANNLAILKRKNMKHLIFSLIVMMFFGTGVYGQNHTQKDFEKSLEETTLTFVNQSRGVYEKGDSYEKFKFKLIGSGNLKTTTSEGDALLRKAFKDIAENKS